MDKYTKFILSIIAVGVLGLNFHLFNGGIITSAEARHDYQAGSGMRGHVIIENWPSSITCK